ncbi:hypothetical protein BJV74DRAFT_799629 [Russula compacta]|nr:hypothetical protein BJV74DRAFT_799629 [Russula compacta]
MSTGTAQLAHHQILVKYLKPHVGVTRDTLEDTTPSRRWHSWKIKWPFFKPLEASPLPVSERGQPDELSRIAYDDVMLCMTCEECTNAVEEWLHGFPIGGKKFESGVRDLSGFDNLGGTISIKRQPVTRGGRVTPNASTPRLQQPAYKYLYRSVDHSARARTGVAAGSQYVWMCWCYYYPVTVSF